MTGHETWHAPCHALGIMPDVPRGNTPPDVSSNGEILEGMTGVGDAERLARLRLAIEAVWQQAKTLNAEITQEMERLGLPLPPDKAQS